LTAPGGAEELARRKAALRERMKAVRKAISPEEREALARAMEDRLFALPALGQAHTVMLFSSFGSEIRTVGLVRRLMDEGRRVLLPFVDGTEMGATELRPEDALVSTSYGPREPAQRRLVDPGDVDLVLAPGLAFDRHGYRIGYGAGYYDRYLARLRPDALRVGIGFHLQVVEEVPHGPADEPLDLVVTDRETIDCRRSRKTSPRP
jgi:5-formyltetrahydrofolate cyclo-ligase